MGDPKSQSDWVFGLSLVQVMLLLVFAAMLISVTENGEVRGQEEASAQGAGLQARLDAATEKSNAL